MKRCLAVAAAVIALWAPVASAQVFIMPTDQATVTGPNEVTVTWQHEYGSYVILWQDGYDTLRPNTGSTVIENVASGTHQYQVCYPGTNQEICAPVVTATV